MCHTYHHNEEVAVIKSANDEKKDWFNHSNPRHAQHCTFVRKSAAPDIRLDQKTRPHVGTRELHRFFGHKQIKTHIRYSGVKSWRHFSFGEADPGDTTHLGVLRPGTESSGPTSLPSAKLLFYHLGTGLLAAIGMTPR
ncbi:hypothetical protein E4U55_005114 [Claviceps digitariae]|nr:hypothetical protein E4U55_005114 [Claviceps digitariae]